MRAHFRSPRRIAAVLRKPVTGDHIAFVVEQTLKRHAGPQQAG